MGYKVIKLENGRFFSDYKNGRINTAWCVAGAKIFQDTEHGKQQLLFAALLIRNRKKQGCFIFRIELVAV